MACNNNPCRLCRRLILSQAVTYASGVLTINLPAGAYANGERYCLVIAQPIPADALIGAPVVVTIGSGTVQYPLNKANCAQAVAANLRTRTRYPVRVAATPTGGSFRLLGRVWCAPDNSLTAIDGGTAAEAGGGDA